MRILLRHLSGSEEGKRQVLPVTRLLLGRDEDCDIRFDLHKDLEVSGRHAELIPAEDKRKVEIVDLDSTNGVLVNGEEVKQRLLQNGDTFELGHGGPKIHFQIKRAILRSLLARIFSGSKD